MKKNIKREQLHIINQMTFIVLHDDINIIEKIYYLPFHLAWLSVFIGVMIAANKSLFLIVINIQISFPDNIFPYKAFI